MVKLADKMGPEGSLTDDTEEAMSESIDCNHPIDVLESSVTESTPILSLLGVTRKCTASIPTPGSEDSAAPAPPAKYERIRKTLHSLFPSPQDMEMIVRSSPGPAFVFMLFYSNRQIVEGQVPPLSSLAVIPDVSSHPTILASGLLQVTIFLQQLPVSFDASQLQSKKSIQEMMTEFTAAVSSLVTSGDELVGSIEGLECLMLQGFYQANNGNLRKSWLSFRRALSLAQLMGIERKGATRALPSCDTGSDRGRNVLLPQRLWFRINFCDRYQSLMLGLPVGTLDNSFASEEMLMDDSPVEKLEKLYTVIAGRVIERNAAKTAEAFAMTQSIDCELEMAAKTMGSAWWKMPDLHPEVSHLERINQMSRMMLQIYHHNLLLLLHLPYMLRDPTEFRYDYSKNTCLQSSREVLQRCIHFRDVNNTAYCCRHVDYCALVAAMTLLLGNFWSQTGTLDEARRRQRAEDRALVEAVKASMDELAHLNHDKLSGEAAEMIQQMLPIMDKVRQGDTLGNAKAGADNELAHLLQLNVPYLGTVNINPSSHANPRQAMDDGRNSQMPTPASTTRSSSTAHSGAFDSLSNPSLFLSLDSSLDNFNDPAMYTPNDDMDTLGSTHNEFHDLSSAFPGITADACDWAFQGVDTTYWSLINSGMNFSHGQ